MNNLPNINPYDIFEIIDSAKLYFTIGDISNAYTNTNDKQFKINTLTHILGKIDINVKNIPLQNNNSECDSRILLNTNRNRADYSRLIHYQCNGLIIDIDTWDIICFPSHGINPVFKKKDLINYCSQIPINKQYFQSTKGIRITSNIISDGTIVNLYHWNNKWYISTHNGIVMNQIKPINACKDVVFTQIMDDLFKKFNIKKEYLKESQTHTFCIRHPYIHFLDIKKKFNVTYIKSTDNNTGISHYNSKFDNILQKQVYINNIDQINKIYANAESALDNYLRNKATMRETEPYYGEIIEICIDNKLINRIFIESTLMSKIRKLCYNTSKKDACYLNPKLKDKILQNKYKYLALRAYLDYPNKSMFINLFPCFSDEYSKITNYISDIVNGVILLLRGEKLIRLNYFARNTNSEYLQIVKQISEIFYKIVNEKVVKIINVYDKDTKNIIYDMILDLKYIHIYVEHLY